LDDPILIDIVGGSMYPESAPPIEITFQNSTHVGFKVINTWETSFNYVFTEYHEGAFGQTECLEEENIESHAVVDEYIATCMHHVPLSIVNVWVVDTNGTWFDEMDDAEVPECCHPPDNLLVPTVQYTFKLPCHDPCAKNQRLLSKQNNSGKEVTESAVKKNVIVSQTATATSSILDGKDGHFCVSEDYPCGDDNDRVHVCHYSARDGYKTFCVPEADSDVLAFYKKDYCGPCVGGYGGRIKRK